MLQLLILIQLVILDGGKYNGHLKKLLDAAWEEWVDNEDALAWQEKYASVLQV
jgi:hypothetical protein